jgi:regulatory protein
MVVRFPSDPFGGGQGDGSGAAAPDGESEHLATVTPLRRPGARAEAGRHPAGTGRAAGRTSELRPGTSAGAGAGAGVGGGADADGAAEVVEFPGATPWNNTWATDERPSAARAGSPSKAAGADSAELEDDEADRQAKKVSAVTIRQLARRGMSRWELEQVLLKRELEPEVFAPELDRLENLGVIDDASLAVSLAFTQHSRKGLGRTAIEQDLKRRHIDPELIEIALADIADEDELDRATELAVKRIEQLSSYDDETVRRRLHGFLARKGYSSSIVRQAMDAAFAGRKRGGVRFQ